MKIGTNEHVDYALSQKLPSIPDRVPVTPVPGNTMVSHTPRKSSLERFHFGETTLVEMQVVSEVRAERLSDFFEQTCDRRPHKTAVISGSSQLTYQELDCQANRLAHFLISHGVEERDRIGLLLERSLNTYISLLGVLKAGAVFVPLDPSTPSDRLAFIAKDAGLRGILTTSALREKTNNVFCPVLELDKAYEVLSTQRETRPGIHVDPASLCSINYPAPNTKHPRGVGVSHSSIVTYLRGITPLYRLTRFDRVYQGMPIASDFSMGEIWMTWIAGATLVTGLSESAGRGHMLSGFLIEQHITILCCQPPMLDSIADDVPSLRTLLVVGEACPAHLVSRWLRTGRRMLKTYGPTETMVNASWSELLPGHPVTIRTLFQTDRIYVLDDRSRLVEDGECGVIYIGRPGVVMNDLQLPTHSGDRFMPESAWYDWEPVPRLYRTGDCGRITPQGEIEYLGQIETRLKNSGFSIEGDSGKYVTLSPGTPALLEAFPRATTTPLKDYMASLELESSVIIRPGTEQSEPRLLNQLNLKRIISHIMTDPLYRNSIFNMASTFVLGGLGFVFWIVIARLYRTEDVGVATTLISIMALLSSFTIMGLHSSLPRYLPRSSNKNELMNSSFVIVTLATLLVSVIFLLGLQVFSPRLLFLRSNAFYAVSFIVLIIFCSWNILVESIFMAFRSAGNILIKNIIISLLKLGLPFALIALGAYGIFASSASAFALGVLVSLVILLFRFKFRPSIVVNLSLIREISVYSFANYIVDFIFNMPSLVLPVIILNLLSAKYAAYYYVVSMFQSILLIIPLAPAQALLIEGSYNEDELKQHVKKAIITILILLIPGTLAFVFAGNFILQFFGKNYASDAFQFLQLSSISTIFTSMILIANSILNIKHRTKTLVISNVLASILTLGLSYLFISDKLVGIGWGWLLGQAIAGLISVYLIFRNLSGSSQAHALPEVQEVCE